MRDDFTQNTKDVLARRVNYLCSNPDCPVATVGPHSEPSKSVNKGVAAHITAAAAGGKRYDPSLTPEERSSASNGIWLCQNCAKLIDSDEVKYTTKLLHAWKTVAESQVSQSIATNSPLLSTDASDLQVRASYAGGHNRCHIHLSLFNAAQTPLYLDGWFAEWGPEDTGSLMTSLDCIKGKLPIRLQAQDKYELIVDLGYRGYTDLTGVGMCAPNLRRWKATPADIRNITSHADRFSVLYPKRDTTDLADKYKDAEIEIKCAVIAMGNEKKQLQVKFTNQSSIAIQLRGAKLDWEYDPPRSTSPADEMPKVQEISGSIDLRPHADLSTPVDAGCEMIFSPSPDLEGILLQTIVGDVNDDDIKITIYTDTDLGWVASGDEVPGCVKESARSLIPKY